MGLTFISTPTPTFNSLNVGTKFICTNYPNCIFIKVDLCSKHGNLVPILINLETGLEEITWDGMSSLGDITILELPKFEKVETLYLELQQYHQLQNGDVVICKEFPNEYFIKQEDFIRVDHGTQRVIECLVNIKTGKYLKTENLSTLTFYKVPKGSTFSI